MSKTILYAFLNEVQHVPVMKSVVFHLEPKRKITFTIVFIWLTNPFHCLYCLLQMINLFILQIWYSNVDLSGN